MQNDINQRTDCDSKAICSYVTLVLKYFYVFQDIDRIRKKGGESHKERVEKFNAYLNSLSEHYEPAKVSWTK